MDRSGKVSWSVKSLHHKHEHFSSHSWHLSKKPDVLSATPVLGSKGGGKRIPGAYWSNSQQVPGLVSGSKVEK